ncbi:transient receptor potential cation channel subfamily V member 5-like [Argonauta hians]
MGVKLSKVPMGVKAQANTTGVKLYKLVDLKGGGELVECMKNMKDMSELDKKIIREVTPFLYNGGSGKKIHISEFIKRRNEERGGKKPISTKDNQNKRFLQKNKSDEEEGDNPKMYRHYCWHIDELGTVGETILHLCLLNSTSTHADLAKRLIRLFPVLINDIYISEEYYGENVLHMAIVNEDPAMVKFLLDHGVDYHQRCYGNFFCPDDQKDSRTDNWDHEEVDVCLETNFEGYTYWGEYPLAFAACVEQEESVRILCAKGCNPNLQDSNGNTIMHILVIKSKLKMFLLLYSFGAQLSIKNRQDLTPLALAAKLARKEMYDHIINLERDQYWEYGVVTCRGYPLREIDTISENGQINTISTLSFVVYGDKEEHLYMMDGIIFSLLQEKWYTFARYRFYRRFFFFTLYFIVFVIAFAVRPGLDPRLKDSNKFPLSYMSDPNNCSTRGLGQRVIQDPIDTCYLLHPYDDYDYVRLPLEVVTVIGAGIYLTCAGKEIYYQGIKIFLTTLKRAPSKAMFLMSCICVFAMIPGRLTCSHEYEDIMGVMAIVCTAPYFLFFCRGFGVTGPFVVMIYSMIKGDLLRFFIIYLIFLMGFSQAMYILFRDNVCSLSSQPLEAITSLFIVSLGTFSDFYNSIEKLNRNSEIAKIIFLLYLLLVSLLLINMLIAMMGNTYQLVASQQMEWFRQWANIVLVIEQSVTPQQRVEQQKQYSQCLANGRRVLAIRCNVDEITNVTLDSDEEE